MPKSLQEVEITKRLKIGRGERWVKEKGTRPFVFMYLNVGLGPLCTNSSDRSTSISR